MENREHRMFYVWAWNGEYWSAIHDCRSKDMAISYVNVYMAACFGYYKNLTVIEQ